MAFGGDVKIREHLPRGSSDLDAYLKPEYAAATKAAPSKPVTRHAPIAARPSAPIVTPTLASEPAPEATPVLLAAATPAPQAADPSSDAQRYAEREPAAQKQQEFRGGDAIVIGAGTLILILLVVILILLLR